MDDAQAARLAEAQGPYVSPAFLSEYYGIELPDDAFMKGFRAWAATLRKPSAIEKPDRSIHRHGLESYLQFSELLPRKWAAVQLGMTEESLDQVEQALQEKQLLLERAHHPRLYREADLRNFHKRFARTRDRVFRNHSNFCERLHEAIGAELGIDVRPVRCTTSEKLSPQNPDFAHDIDIITLAPMGLRYQVWLNFHKPVHLRPDACSTLFFIQEEQVLKKFAMVYAEEESIIAEVRDKLAA